MNQAELTFWVCFTHKARSNDVEFDKAAVSVVIVWSFVYPAKLMHTKCLLKLLGISRPIWQGIFARRIGCQDQLGGL